jgi:hypothetical protein
MVLNLLTEKKVIHYININMCWENSYYNNKTKIKLTW